MSAAYQPLAGKRALVTGGGVGIGFACARRLAEQGAEVIVWGNESIREAPDQLIEGGPAVRKIVCDLSDVAAARQQAEELAAETQVDILLNNAGIIYREPAATHDPAAWQRVIDINLNAAWTLSQVLGAKMIERGDGRIVSIASLLTFQGGINVPSYAASKHAVAGITKALANEWAATGVTVNAVAPGYIATDNTAALRADVDRERAIRERIPAGRWGTPEDIAGAVAFLAGPEAGYINGHVLVVDGGWLAR